MSVSVAVTLPAPICQKMATRKMATRATDGDGHERWRLAQKMASAHEDGDSFSPALAGHCLPVVELPDLPLCGA